MLFRSHESLGPAHILLYMAGVFWTLGYDTIYAHQDTRDDALIGVRSTALRFSAHSRLFIAGSYFFMNLLLILTGYMATLNIYFWFIVGAVILHSIWQIWRVNLDDEKSCLYFFKSNRDQGALILLAFIIGYF